MAFMNQEVTDLQTWLEIDGDQGITFVPFDILESPLDATMNDGTDNEDGHLTDLFGMFYEGDIDTVTIRRGYGARMSASGYMDCTEWSVFDTEAAAKSYLDENYGDEEDTDDVQSGAVALHVFNPDHNLYCLDCGSGELMGNHGMIPGDGGASGTDFSPMYASEDIRQLYDTALDLTDYEQNRPDYALRAYLNKDEK